MARGATHREWAFVVAMVGVGMIMLRWTPLQEDLAFTRGADTASAKITRMSTWTSSDRRMSGGRDHVAGVTLGYEYRWHGVPTRASYECTCADNSDADRRGCRCRGIQALADSDSVRVVIARSTPRARPLAAPPETGSNLAFVVIGFLLFPFAIWLFRHDFGNG